MLEVAAEVELVGVANLFGHFLDGVGAFNQASLGLINTHAPEEVDWSLAGHSAETTEEIRYAHVRDFSQILDAPRTVEV
jgi:hypothetical protein